MIGNMNKIRTRVNNQAENDILLHISHNLQFSASNKAKGGY